jgi:hypothetical protein
MVAAISAVQQHRGSQPGDQKVLVSQTPVVTCYSAPTQRVLFSPMRDANPFFHFMEALWMLAGRDDVASRYASTARSASSAMTASAIWGAYGSRWRKWFGHDQLDLIIRRVAQLTRRAAAAF